MAWYYYGRTKPRKVVGGIKAGSRRGAFGHSWWAREWVRALERFHEWNRLNRGRTYARKGQVLNIEVSAGEVTARVQGSRKRPYQVSLAMTPLTAGLWSAAVGALGSKAIFVAELLAGRMPQDVGESLATVGVSLFPTGPGDLKVRCSCPDWAVPCKHAAAVYYILAEEFDRDPFLLFRLRGRSREDLLGALLGLPPNAGIADNLGPQKARGGHASDGSPKPASSRATQPVDPGAFWHMTPGSLPTLNVPRIPRDPAPALRRLGAFPFWRGEEPLADSLELRYAGAAQLALDLLTQSGTPDSGPGKKSRPAPRRSPSPAPEAPPVLRAPELPSSTPSNLCNQRVDQQPFPTRLSNILALHGITTLEELAGMPDRQLLTMDGVGRLSLQRIRTALLAARSRAEPQDQSLLSLPIEQLPMKGWTYNRLKRDAGINTVGELVLWSPRELLNIHALGRKTLKEITSVVNALGLKLAEG